MKRMQRYPSPLACDQSVSSIRKRFSEEVQLTETLHKVAEIAEPLIITKYCTKSSIPAQNPPKTTLFLRNQHHPR